MKIMLKKIIAACTVFLFFASANAQYKSSLTAEKWVDSVFKTLSKEEKIAQLMVIRAHSNLGPEHIGKVVEQIQKYNVGALCFFQGGPVRQANLTNYYQNIARTPVMVTIDAEWGLGMRLDSVIKFPYQLTLGALQNPDLVYKMGQAVAAQCKRMGIHVNYAPAVDINNNPGNPVIGFRSFGEDKYKVAQLGIAYMKGMQDGGIMACAKHFPGHGDTETDSHLDLPLINKTMAQLDSLELYPFREIFKAGIGSAMIAHLSIPSIDNTANRPTTLSKNNVTNLLRIKLGFNGLVFTDALEMKGVTKYFPAGEAAVEALIAGNDMLCLPENVDEAIDATKKAIKKKKLKWDDIDAKVKKVLLAKYQLGLNERKIISTDNLTNDLNAQTDAIRSEVAKKTITVLALSAHTASRNDYATIPMKNEKRIAYVGIGTSQLNAFGKRMKDDYNADVFLFSYKDSSIKADSIFAAVGKDKYDAVIVGIHEFSNRPANNYGISNAAIKLWKDLNFIKTSTFVFGNVLATKNFCDAWTLAACYQDDNITQEIAADLLKGNIGTSGKLPVTVCKFGYGTGIAVKKDEVSFLSLKANRLRAIDSIANDAIAKKAFPGCVVMAVKDGEILYHKAFGNYQYENNKAVNLESVYDLASVTKISATTIAIMKLYEQGKIELKKTLGDYLPVVRGTNKAKLQIDDILLHQAGLVPFIQFYKETVNASGIPSSAIYSPVPSPQFSVRVAEKMYMRNDWSDTIMKRILQSPLTGQNRYVYSDNDFIFLGKIVEQLSGMTLDQYVQKNIYSKIGLATTGYKPLNRFTRERIIPTEKDQFFRQQLLWGDVHDEGTSMFGGVAGHAGLFSTAYDLSMLYQMLLNGGEINGERILNAETINYFTKYHSNVSRRGLGFDKPEKDNDTRAEPYPSKYASSATYGHTGYTGIGLWVDPKYNLIFIFLSNRVYPTRENPKFSQLNVRSKIQDALYTAIGVR
jgi:beta-N-acetylhexosaminidase